jgi:hypothetical protein
MASPDLIAELSGEPYAWADPVDPWQEHADYEANAGFDYLREAYGATAEGLADDDGQPEDCPPFLRNTGFWSAQVCACRAPALRSRFNAAFGWADARLDDDFPF